jgi:hypothetical protein
MDDMAYGSGPPVESMPRSIETVLTAQGDQTSF